MTRRPASRRGAAVLALVLALGIPATLTACAPTAEVAEVAETPRPLSGTEAERLAAVRFRNFDAGTRPIDVRIPGTEAGELRLTGWFDYETKAGYAAASTDEGSAGLVWWNESTIAVREAPVEEAPLPLPADGWESGPLDPSSTSMAAVLALLGGLGSDRPENPQLLLQSDAAWLRADEVAGTEVDVFAGPSDAGADATDVDERPRFWVDERGVLLRFEARLGGAPDWTVTDLGDSIDVTVPAEVPPG